MYNDIWFKMKINFGENVVFICVPGKYTPGSGRWDQGSVLHFHNPDCGIDSLHIFGMSMSPAEGEGRRSWDSF